jgi:hypothetical protein
MVAVSFDIRLSQAKLSPPNPEGAKETVEEHTVSGLVVRGACARLVNKSA